jgi:molybdopterin-guanine dinucleotide biosynthesis protein
VNPGSRRIHEISASPPVFIFVGHSGSGKTTLIEKLLPELEYGRGLRLATIKHAHHKVALDKEGKDSWRYKQAGAAMSMLVTADELQLVADAVDRREPAQLAERFLGEADMVLAEGFSLAAGCQDRDSAPRLRQAAALRAGRRPARHRHRHGRGLSAAAALRARRHCRPRRFPAGLSPQ